jgi:hypothetical protein
LDKCLREAFGKKYTECQNYTCYPCLFNKTHQLPHPRLSAKDRAEKNGHGAFAEIFLDTVSYPFPGENGERFMALLYNTGRNIACLCSRTKAETPDLVIKTMDLWEKLYGKVDILNSSAVWWQFLMPQDGEKDHTANRITKMTYDGAAEFMGAKLQNSLDKKGILHRATCRYTPQQNAAENVVKLVTQGMETLLWQSGLPRMFWCRSAEYYCKVYEFLPNSAARGTFVTPHEALVQRKIPFKRLNMFTFSFGEEVFYHNPRELRRHTHGCPKSERGVFLGFSRRKKGYDILSEDCKILEGVYDVFFTGEFPLRKEADKSKQENFNKGIQEKTSQLWSKFGPPTTDEDANGKGDHYEHGEFDEPDDYAEYRVL